MKNYFLFKFIVFSTEFFRNIYLDSEKGIIVPNIVCFMLENLRKSLDKGLKTGVLLTDLSKVFDSISHRI